MISFSRIQSKRYVNVCRWSSSCSPASSYLNGSPGGHQKLRLNFCTQSAVEFQRYVTVYDKYVLLLEDTVNALRRRVQVVLQLSLVPSKQLPER